MSVMSRIAVLFVVAAVNLNYEVRAETAQIDPPIAAPSSIPLQEMLAKLRLALADVNRRIEADGDVPLRFESAELQFVVSATTEESASARVFVGAGVGSAQGETTTLRLLVRPPSKEVSSSTSEIGDQILVALKVAEDAAGSMFQVCKISLTYAFTIKRSGTVGGTYELGIVSFGASGSASRSAESGMTITFGRVGC